MNDQSVTRRTLPAPHEPLDVDAIRMDRDRLKLENRTLLEENLRLRNRLASQSPESDRLPTPTSLPRDMEPSNRGIYTNDDPPTGGPREGALTPNAGLDFGTVARLSDDELDKLPYGLICLDAQGRIVRYNDVESRLAMLPKERVLGRNFFSEVAPCTRVREFEGTFHDLVRDPSRVRVRTFDFVFRFRHAEQHVTIVMTPARTRGLYNLALLRRRIVPQ